MADTVCDDAANAVPIGGGVNASAAVEGFITQLKDQLRFAQLIPFGAIAFQFALVVAALRLLNIETPAFEHVATVALGGFVVHHFLPVTWKLPFFSLMSIATLFVALGLNNAAWLLGLGLLLIAICHLPVSFALRIGIILVVAVGLAVMRTGPRWGITGSPIPPAIWSILGSMFMFRLIAYLYDLKHRAASFSPLRAIAYFFMVPNVCFSLFPVVDYKAMQRSWYDDEALAIYQSGVKWMARGLLQLVLYRWVYYKGVIDPASVVSGMDAARYMLMTYLLYLKVSGIFHVVIGMLHMFGFALPETHHLYLFSSSFTDFWRRINIYWKDFIQKIVFTPVFFRLKGLGHERAMAVATLVAFGMTWFFHSYQVFWIRGDFPLVWTDIVFWFGLGAVVLVNVMLESRRGRKRSLKKPVRRLRDDAILALKIAGTFASICVLWTIWSTPDLDELLIIGKGLLRTGPGEAAILIGVPLALGVVGATLGRRQRETSGTSESTAPSSRTFWMQSVAVSAAMLGLIVVTLKPILIAPVAPHLAELVRDIREGHLNEADQRLLQRGYYEDIGDPTRFNADLWKIYGQRPPGWEDDLGQGRRREDEILREYVPSTVATFKGAERTINSLGMRDREYSVAKPPGVFRIAVIGASHDAGSGVGDRETYENLVEDRLNRDLGPTTGRVYEILNFSVGGYAPFQKLATIERRILAFEPDVIVYVAHGQELDWTSRNVTPLIERGLLDEVPYIEDALERAGVHAGADEAAPRPIVIENALAPFADDIIDAVLRRFQDVAGARGITPCLMLLEIPDDQKRPKAFVTLTRIADEIGLTALDTYGAFASVENRETLWIAPWDSHTNALGHRLIADRLYSLLIEKGVVPSIE